MSKIAETDLILNDDGSVYHLSLKPEHLADTIIAVGDPGRVHRVSRFFDKVEFEMNKREFITHTGYYQGKRLTVLSTGIGTDNVEIALMELDALVNINLATREEKAEKKSLQIIRIGTSGAIQLGVPLGAHLVSEYGVGLDSLMAFYQPQYSAYEEDVSQKLQQATGLSIQPYVVKGTESLLQAIKGEDMLVGNTLTCPGFYAPQGRILRAATRLPQWLDDLTYFHEDNFWLTNFEMETAGYYALGRLLGHQVLSANAIIANRISKQFSKSPDKVVDSLIKKVLERVAAL